MNTVTYQIATLVISLIGVILSGLIVPWLRMKIGKEKISQVQMWVNVAVAAAEQIFSAPQQGPSKKVYVIEFLESKGIKITEQELNVLIEAAVFELNKAREIMFIDDAYDDL